MKKTNKAKDETTAELSVQKQKKAPRKVKAVKDCNTCKNTRALTISEIRYRRLFQSAKDGILILDAETGKIIDVNPFLIELLKYSKEQFIEKAIWEIGFFKDIAANRDNFLELQQKEYVRYEDLPLETSDGRLINVEFVSNVYIENKHKVIQCNIRDITIRKKAENIQRENNSRLELAMHVANMAWWEMDISSGTVTFDKGKAEMLGYPPEIFKHYKDFMALVHPEDYDNTMNAMREHLDGKQDKYECEYRIKILSGSYKWFYDIGSIVKRDSVGVPKTITGLVINITERKLAEEELSVYRNHLEYLVNARTREFNKANESLKNEIIKKKEMEEALEQSLAKEKDLSEIKSRFISTTSHEFRTPLTTVLSSAELLQKYGERWSLEKKSGHLDRIKNSVMYLTKLLDEILTISRAETGQIKFNPEQINLKEFAKENIDESKNLTHSHKFIYSFNSKQTMFQLDPKLMKFIISNLLSNAIKYSPDGGTIELTITANSDFLNLGVKDDGIGISCDETDKIFDSFYRSKNSGNIPGTGLGLSIVKRAVDLHNGEINVKSEIGKGTTFNVVIPLCE
ncbi:MAG: PAS domain-containing sensor histidine kinase [Bacteroidota bacterium]